MQDAVVLGEGCPSVNQSYPHADDCTESQIPYRENMPWDDFHARAKEDADGNTCEKLVLAKYKSLKPGARFPSEHTTELQRKFGPEDSVMIFPITDDSESGFGNYYFKYV